MKKIFTVIAALVFAFSVLFLSVLNASAKVVTTKTETVLVLTPTPTPKAEILYYLPYPGILPDHPLYSFKMIRDRIWLWLTSGAEKKAEIVLLFADKRLGAGRFLIEGNKIDLGITTIEKAEKYLEQAVLNLEEAKKQGEDVSVLAKKIKTAAEKHQELISDLAQGLSSERKETLVRLTQYSERVILGTEKLLD
ncbi:MAG: hypothetical protein BWY24_00212 [Microgenomates group bacterium ADurb.Bin219]|nr:MAG: hypothetical protein BWY24_00212 [Microgenomates group bacterium ADurb.Bin219]HNP89037.1 DUF5667 domain-containing protein [Candidatus Woesebacteria bacterium]